MTKNTNPAIEVAKRHQAVDTNEPVTLSTGIKAILTPVPVMILEEVAVSIKDPTVPLQKIEGKDGEFENPNDPQYLRDLNEVNTERGVAVYDVMIAMGIEIVGGVPPADEWLPKLKFLQILGRLDLSKYDLEDKLTQEFLYKKYIAVGAADLTALGQQSGISEEGLERAKELFLGQT